jgi:hypothetical protein
MSRDGGWGLWVDGPPTIALHGDDVRAGGVKIDILKRWKAWIGLLLLQKPVFIAAILRLSCSE